MAYPTTLTALIVAAVAVLARAVTLLVDRPYPPWVWTRLVLTGVALVGCALTVVRVRIGAAYRSSSMTDAVILFGCVLLPGAWLVVTVAAASLLGWALRPPWPVRQFPDVARDTLCAAAAAAVASALGVLNRFPVDRRHIVALLAVAAVIVAVENLVSLAVVSTASGLGLPSVARVGALLWYPTQAARMAVALVAVVVVAGDPRLLLAASVLLVAVHLTMANRLRARIERAAWQRLAEACDELAHGDLDRVLGGVVGRMVALFSTDEVELELGQPAPHRLVRGDASGITYDGPIALAPDRRGYLIRGPLPPEGATGSARIGLRLRRPVRLSDREWYALRALSAAVDTAQRNANAVSQAMALAADQARAAGYHALTGLPNRHRLFAAGTRMLGTAPATRCGMILIDLDNFREVNDALGHGAGDQVLAEIGRRLSAAAGPRELVAHLGEDEFAVLLADLNTPAGAMARSRVILAALDPPVPVDEVALPVSATAGIALAGDDPATVEELLRRADIAMHQAKRDGEPIALYTRHRDTADRGRLMLTAELSRAVSAREFEASFQPIVDLSTGQVIAAEALARWHHPDRGALDPRRFLDSVERSALLPAFSEAVLTDALRGAAAWRAGGFDIPVAVNVSPRSLVDPTFPEAVAQCLTRAGLPSTALVLEVTESLTLSQLEVVDEVLRLLAQAGVRVALDDFGTGYSSLATLARVPVDELKIDRTFVAGLDAPTQAAVVRSTIDLGRRLDLLVVAEGVETQEQSTRLWEWGCQAGQGHLFARPMPLPQLIDLLNTGHDGHPGTLAAPRGSQASAP